MRLTTPSGTGEFIWAAGIEDTFIAAPHPVTGRILDEYALTEHYERWEEDLALLAELGVNAARVGIPWYRVCPRPGVFDWDWTDRVLERLVRVHHIEPIIDLVHYGTPLWLANSFLDPDYPRHVADYAHAFADRYRDLCAWYTPLNEPRVNAWYAGRLGWWPPYGRSWRSFAAVLVQLCRGICRTQAAVRQAVPEAVFVHVDATDLYLPEDPSDSRLCDEASFRQNLVFLALDLVMGRVDESHALWRWLEAMQSGSPGLVGTLEELRAGAVTPDIIGYNMYPMFSRKVVRRAGGGGIRVKITPCWTETLVELSRMYAARYAPLPVMVTETASAGSMKRRVQWIEESTEAILRLRQEGLPVIGYTFWPLTSLVTWAYQKGRGSRDEYLLHMGLWDLLPGPNGLERLRTPAAEAYRGVVAGGRGRAARRV